MNFEKYYIDGKAIINPSDKNIKIPEGARFEMNGWRQLSKELDKFLYNYYNVDLFNDCRINEAIFESLRCVIIMLENILEVIDERSVDYIFWSEILTESKNLSKELE